MITAFFEFEPKVKINHSTVPISWIIFKAKIMRDIDGLKARIEITWAKMFSNVWVKREYL